MQIDHIFIFSKNGGEEANELVEFGFVEGSNRVHIGQGTANRKFYFENFFLEIVWVTDEKEIKSDLVSHTKLWERSIFDVNQGSPFGLCLVNTDDINVLFLDSVKYQPMYFPAGLEIEFLANEDSTYLPWTFRLPFIGSRKKIDEPINHRYDLNRLTNTEFTIPPSISTKNYINHFRGEEHIVFTSSDTCQLILTFNNYQNGRVHQFKNLPLIIKY